MVDSSENQPKSATVVVLSGPSGSGKTTIVERLIAESPVALRKSVSATTRLPRVGERHGDAYYFLAHDEFETRRRNNEFVECAEVFKTGNWYGTLRSEVEQAVAGAAWAFLEIDVQGALRVMEQYSDAITVFLRTPSEAIYEQRLRNRGTEEESVIQRRLQTAREELQFAGRYRFQVVNDNLDQAVAEIIQILIDEEKNQHA